MSDPLILGERLYSTTTRLMGALHAENIATNQMDEAEPSMVPVYESALVAFRAQTADAWSDCIGALSAWADYRNPDNKARATAQKG